uniref:Membrane-associated kinase regulator 4 n=1 Tax=Salix viminalis TaxID=40686 RepID=A0A6N2LT64_SALVM
MAMSHLLSYDKDDDDDDYIDMEVSSRAIFFSPPFPKEFEFQMSTTSMEKDTTTSPADELFYKGKLLPLHLPPRLQMVEKILENSNSSCDHRRDTFEEFFSTPLMTAAPTPTSTSTPFESCNVSPAESCCVSRELNPEEYVFEYSSQFAGFIDGKPKSSWTRKLNMIKQSSLSSKLKSSRAYLKSLFGKSGCADDSCTVASKVADEVTVSKSRESLNKHVKTAKKKPFGQIQKDGHRTSATATQNKQKISEDGGGRLHRRSFSMSIKRHSTNKSSSSESSSDSSSFSSSTGSNGFQRLPFPKRSSSAKFEIENPIQGAIAHCKQSQHRFHSRNIVNEAKFYSLSASRMSMCDEQERPVLCRG